MPKKDRDEYGSMILCYVLIANFRMLRIDNISSLIRYQLLIVIYLANHQAPDRNRSGGGPSGVNHRYTLSGPLVPRH